MKFFEPEFTLRPTLEKRHEDQNTKEVSDDFIQKTLVSFKFLQAIREYVCENLRRVQGAPSVQMQPIPTDCMDKDILVAPPEVNF